ncbi:MAG: Regulator of RpoS [Chroococcopsis gigantea SAG 12.99]|jgi:DNA-binding response OmpR family regulator|nr:response regulator [Chlorogloea purpurea SAG 13.99]MDV3001476.1 Regulator of RpoS [Chroococcopsis gigantea SAG 12.99]
MRLLLVEDDELLADRLTVELNGLGYVMDTVRDGEDGWNYSQAVVYDLIVLDVSLPKLSGIALCAKLRQNSYKGPILLLTANTDSSSKVKGLDAGADDYVVKPCTIEELSARIRALLRRGDAVSNPVLKWGELSLNPSSREVIYQQQTLSLSAKEYSLLELLIRHPRIIFSSAAILDHLWSFEEVPGEDTVRAHIKRLRKKLNAVGAAEIIETVYGMGYRLNSAAAQVNNAQELSERIKDKVAQTWEKLREPILSRVKDIDNFVKEKTLPSYQSAQMASHKLAGSLGMFGFGEGSRLAKEIDRLLKNWEDNYKNWESLKNYLQLLRAQFPENLVTVTQNSDNNNAYTAVKIEVLIISQDTDWKERVEEDGKKWGMNFTLASNMKTAFTEIDKKAVQVIILNLDQQGLDSLDKLSYNCPQIPIIVLAESESFLPRLEVARRGGRRFVTKSTPVADIISLVRDVVYLQPSSALNVLAVDDDEMILEFLRQTLSPWGFCVTTLQRAEKFWETLQGVKPDLLLLDVEMEGITGIELCRVVRNAKIWDSLPVIFFTSCQSAEVIQSIFNAGADDYISKPIESRELVSRIVKRMRRHAVNVRGQI